MCLPVIDGSNFFMLTNGNSKLGKGIWAFNLPRSSCMHKTTYCDKYCYAKRGTFATTGVKRSMTVNLRESLRDDFVDRIISQIRAFYIRYVRIHPSGDFYSQEYADKWMEIARQSPKTRFLAYTRNYDADFSERPENFKIYYTVDEATIAFNQTIERTATVFKSRETFKHMERTPYGFVCESKCKTCKACWSGAIDIAFKLR